MQRKIRFNLKIDRDRYIYDLSELNNINLDLFIEHFDNGILSDWLYIHNHNKEYEYIENLKKELYDLDQEKKDEHKIKSLSELFEFNNSDVEKFIRKIKNEKNNINNNISNTDISLKKYYDEYSKLKEDLFKIFHSEMETFGIDVSIGINKYISKYLLPKKEHLKLLKDLNENLGFWKDIPLISDNIKQYIKDKKAELQPILFYLMLSDKFNNLNNIAKDKDLFGNEFASNLIKKDYKNNIFIDFYLKQTNSFFKLIDEKNSSGIESNVIVIKNEGFDIGDAKFLEVSEKISFKLNAPKSKKASLVLLMLDHIEV
jgi:hypothetical protein